MQNNLPVGLTIPGKKQMTVFVKLLFIDRTIGLNPITNSTNILYIFVPHFNHSFSSKSCHATSTTNKNNLFIF